MSNEVKRLIEVYLSGKLTVVDFVEALTNTGLSEEEVSDLIWEEGCIL